MDPYNLLAALVLLVVLALRLAVAPSDLRRALNVSLILVGTTLLGTVSLRIATCLSVLRPLKYDLFVYRIDGLLGFQPSFFLGRLAEAYPWLSNLLKAAYGAEPVAIVLVYAAYLWLCPPSQLRIVVQTFVLNLFIAPVFYLPLPVAGPRFAFEQFPLEPGLLTPHRLLLDAAPNGVPSVHFSTALLILWLCWRWIPGRIAASVYLILIFGATLASGEHYLFDLVAAIPYAAAVHWAVSKRPVPAERMAHAYLPAHELDVLA